MKIVAIVPIKKKSLRVKNKNFRPVNKKPLYQYTLEKLKYCKFDEFYVDSDSDKVRAYCKKNKIRMNWDYSPFTTTNFALTPVVKFHWLLIIKFPFSWYTLKAAVLGPESPWFNAKNSILLKPGNKAI